MFFKKTHNKILMLSILIGILINYFIALKFIYSDLLGFRLRNMHIHIFVIIITVSSLLQALMVVGMNIIISKYKESLNILEQITENLPNAVFVHKKFQIVFTNTKGAEFFDQKKPEDIIGQPLQKYINLNVPIIGEERMVDAIQEERFKPLTEEVVYKANGEVVEIEVYSTPIEIKGKIAVLNLLKDITEQKKLKELEKKIEEEQRKLKETLETDRLRTEFFANLSHEFKTPITLIYASTQLIERDMKIFRELEQKFEPRIHILKQNCFRLLRLINNLIDITKINTGFFTLEAHNYEIISIIENISLSVVDYAKNKGINIEFDTNVEEKMMSCDLDKIERIMLNLLSNALKFTKSGGNIKINIFDEITNLKIVVEDDGVGIPKNKLNTIFDRFVQIDKSFTRNTEGSGIGLSIVKALVELHEGSIDVDSEYGNGTTFTITIPIKIMEGDIKSDKYKTFDQESRAQKVDIEFSDIYM